MVIIVDDKKKANAITHSGTFHADEVFATAFLDEIMENVYLFRTPIVQEEDFDKKIVYDIGKGKFDHHYLSAKVRPTGIKYSSFGLLYHEYGKKYLKSLEIENIDEVFEAFDKDFVEQIDAIDNGVFPKIEATYRVKTISDIIKIFNPSFASDQDETVQFLKAVSIASKIIEEELNNCIAKVKANKLIEKLLEKNKEDYLLLDEYIPYEETILGNKLYNNIKLVAYPSNRGGYCIKTLSKSPLDKKERLSLPIAWRGKENEELEKTVGIKNVEFCHPTGFIMGAKDKKTIKKVIEKLLEEKNEEVTDK